MCNCGPAYHYHVTYGYCVFFCGFFDYHGQLLRYLPGGQLAQGCVVDGDCTGGGFDGTVEEAQQGGFAGAVGADEPQDFALAGGQGDVVDHALVAVGVGESGAGDHGWIRSTTFSSPVTDRGVAGSVKFNSWVMTSSLCTAVSWSAPGRSRRAASTVSGWPSECSRIMTSGSRPSSCSEEISNTRSVVDRKSTRLNSS